MLDSLMKSKRNRRQGATLVTVILLGLVLTAIGSIAFVAASRSSTRLVQERSATAAFQVADAASEYVRNAMLTDQSSSGTSPFVWANNINSSINPVRAINVKVKNAGTADDIVTCVDAAAGLGCLTPADYDPTITARQYPNRSFDLTGIFRNVYTKGFAYAGDGTATDPKRFGRVVGRIFQDNPLGSYVIKVTAQLPDGTEATIVKGVGTGAPATTSMLTRNVNCAFCHLQVVGDVGALSHVRPGWDAKSSNTDVGYSEVSGAFSACTSAETGSTSGFVTIGCSGKNTGKSDGNQARGNTSVRGNFYGLNQFTDDNNTAKNIQAAANQSNSKILNNVNIFTNSTATGANPTVQGQYKGDYFSQVISQGDIDGDGLINDIPPVDLATAAAFSNGKSLTVSSGGLAKPELYGNADLTDPTLKGAMYKIPYGGEYKPNDAASYTRLSSVSSSVASSTTRDGTLILVGTKSDPIILPENFFFNGDVIIKGYVKGSGNLTAGRNVYFAGEVLTINPPGVAANGSASGNYSNLTDNNVLSQASNDAKNTSLDSLRIYAGGNAIVGDYTDKDASGNKLDIAARQSEFFNRTQFGFDGTKFGIATISRYFDKNTGEEYTLKAGTGTGVKPPIYLDATGKQASSSQVTAITNGRDSYESALKPGKVGVKSDGSDFTPSVTDDLYRQILGLQDVSGIKVTARNDDSKTSTLLKSLTCSQKCEVDPLKVALSPTLPASVGDLTTTIVNQVERIDAFIYANKRIAGTVRGTNLLINGGLATREFGVLAGAAEGTLSPGNAKQNLTTACKASGNTNLYKNLAATNLLNKPLVNNYCNGLDFGTSNSDSSTATNTGNGLTVNYDFRIKVLDGSKFPIAQNGAAARTRYFRLGGPIDRTFPRI